MLPGGRYVKFTPKLVIPKWVPRGCLIRSFMSDAKGSGNVNTGTLAGADAASMAAVEKSAGMLLPGRSVGHISILCQTFNHIESTFRDPGSNVGIVAPTLGLPPAGPGTLLPVTSDCIIATYFTPRPSAIGTERIPKVLNTMPESRLPFLHSTSRLLLNFLSRYQYMRCRNSQPATLSATAPLSAIGQKCWISRWNGRPSRNTPRNTNRK